MKVPWFPLAEAFAVEGAAVFLASDDSPFMTGADQPIDGRYTAW